eukprot:1149881-Pelagomonas_calceolata.AAC.5
MKIDKGKKTCPLWIDAFPARSGDMYTMDLSYMAFAKVRYEQKKERGKKAQYRVASAKEGGSHAALCLPMHA